MFGFVICLQLQIGLRCNILGPSFPNFMMGAGVFYPHTTIDDKHYGTPLRYYPPVENHTVSHSPILGELLLHFSI